MILCIADVLNADFVAELRAILAQQKFVDGKTTAGWHARLVKNNTQLAPGAEGDALRARVRDSVSANDIFATACLLKKFGPMLFSRTSPGMDYGPHVDDALMGSREGRIRSDISFTIFLSDPADYDGGELVMDSTAGEQAYMFPVSAYETDQRY